MRDDSSYGKEKQTGVLKGNLKSVHEFNGNIYNY